MKKKNKEIGGLNMKINYLGKKFYTIAFLALL